MRRVPHLRVVPPCYRSVSWRSQYRTKFGYQALLIEEFASAGVRVEFVKNGHVNAIEPISA